MNQNPATCHGGLRNLRRKWCLSKWLLEPVYPGLERTLKEPAAVAAGAVAASAKGQLLSLSDGVSRAETGRA